MLKHLFMLTILSSFIMTWALVHPALATNGDRGDVEANGTSPEATGCFVLLPASVTKGAMLRIWVFTTGGTFAAYNAKVKVKWPTTSTLSKYQATYRKKTTTGTSGINIETWTPDWSIIQGTLTAIATVKENSNTHKCKASVQVN